MECVVEGFETEAFSFEVPTHAMEGFGTDLSGPEVSTYDVEALMDAESPAEQVNNVIQLTTSENGATSHGPEPVFLDSEPTRAGRKRKAKDMSGLTVCLCGERAKPDDVGSIRCRKAGCATLWVCCSTTFENFMTNTTYSITFNVLGIRTCDRKPGYVTHACASQAQAV